MIGIRNTNRDPQDLGSRRTPRLDDVERNDNLSNEDGEADEGVDTREWVVPAGAG